MKNNAKVTHVRLHLPNFVVGIGEIKRTVDQEFYPGIAMSLCPAGVLCRFREITFIIPYVNAMSITIVDDEKEEKKDAPKNPKSDQ